MSIIRFIHAADLHLDSPFKGMSGIPIEHLASLRNSTFEAFFNLVTYALETKPDFVLIAGDIYDGEDRSLRAQMKFQEGMEKLHASNIPVIISYGNHDHLGGRWTRFDLPPNVHVFGGDVEKLEFNVNGNDVSIYGFSYKERHIRETVIEQYPIAEERNSFHIGMLHGSLAGDETHAVYAPFTKKELLEKQYDYWALGHIHLRQQLHQDPPIVYSGNLQGRHRNERGVKGFYEIELTKSQADLKFIPTSAILFDRLEISCTGIAHANEWLAVCAEALESFKALHGSGVIELTMIDMDNDSIDLFNQSTEEEWLAVLREAVGGSEPFIWVQRISFEERAHVNAPASALVKSVLDVMNEWSDRDWKVILKDVYQHTRGIKYLEILSEEEILETKEGAAAWLTSGMSETE